jgi:hypothetical protein
MSIFYLAWWNLENLFDEENAPPQRRPEKVARAVGRDLAGWTPSCGTARSPSWPR